MLLMMKNNTELSRMDELPAWKDNGSIVSDVRRSTLCRILRAL